jgi:hypothetical protein
MQNTEQIYAARQKLIDYMAHHRISAVTLRQLAHVAQGVMKNKKMYPSFVKKAQELDIPGSEQLTNKFDPQKVAQVIALVKLLELK